MFAPKLWPDAKDQGPVEEEQKDESDDRRHHKKDCKGFMIFIHLLAIVFYGAHFHFLFKFKQALQKL